MPTTTKSFTFLHMAIIAVLAALIVQIFVVPQLAQKAGETVYLNAESDITRVVFNGVVTFDEGWTPFDRELALTPMGTYLYDGTTYTTPITIEGREYSALSTLTWSMRESVDDMALVINQLTGPNDYVAETLVEQGSLYGTGSLLLSAYINRAQQDGDLEAPIVELTGSYRDSIDPDAAAAYAEFMATQPEEAPEPPQADENSTPDSNRGPEEAGPMFGFYCRTYDVSSSLDLEQLRAGLNKWSYDETGFTAFDLIDFRFETTPVIVETELPCDVQWLEQQEPTPDTEESTEEVPVFNASW